MHSLSGQNIIIMGGTTGLGLSAARKLVAAGAQVVVSSRSQTNVDTAVEVLGSNARGFAADAATPEAAERAARDLARPGWRSWGGAPASR